MLRLKETLKVIAPTLHQYQHMPCHCFPILLSLERRAEGTALLLLAPAFISLLPYWG